MGGDRGAAGGLKVILGATQENRHEQHDPRRQGGRSHPRPAPGAGPGEGPHPPLAPARLAAARRAATAILEGAALLGEHPEAGRRLDDARREWFVPFAAGAYVLRSRLDPEGDPVVIRVWHSREDRPRP
ncbi:MAG: type II toxin-antitoxin system RelE/ParE family toxin [Pseudomonadota bacterium]